MSIRKITVLAVSAGLFLAGCATKPEKVKASYVSPVFYENMNCATLRLEAERVSERAIEMTGAQKKKAGDDAVATGVAIVLFWPAAFLVGGDDETTSELARLKGQMEAIEDVSNQKGCGITFQST